MSLVQFPPEILELIVGRLRPREFDALIFVLRLGWTRKVYWRAHAKYMGLIKTTSYFHSCKSYYINDFLPNVGGILLRDLLELCQSFKVNYKRLLRNSTSGLKYVVARDLIIRKVVDVVVWWKDGFKLRVEDSLICIDEGTISVDGRTFAYCKKTKNKWIVEYGNYSPYVFKVLATILDTVSR